LKINLLYEPGHLPKPLKRANPTIIPMTYGGNQRSLEAVKREDMTRQCPDCNSKEIDYEKEEFYCRKCGLVLD
jgi:hypothetical protein